MQTCDVDIDREVSKVSQAEPLILLQLPGELGKRMHNFVSFVRSLFCWNARHSVTL